MGAMKKSQKNVIAKTRMGCGNLSSIHFEITLVMTSERETEILFTNPNLC
jgi:hypothetical protein